MQTNLASRISKGLLNLSTNPKNWLFIDWHSCHTYSINSCLSADSETGFVVENSSRRYLACDAISFNYTLTKWSLYVFVDPLQDSSAWTQGRIGREDKTIQRTRKWLQKYRKWKVNFTSKISFSHVFNIVRFCISLKKKRKLGALFQKWLDKKKQILLGHTTCYECDLR